MQGTVVEIAPGLAEAVVAALVVQTGALLVWSGKITQQLKDHERRIGKVEDDVQHLERSSDE